MEGHRQQCGWYESITCNSKKRSVEVTAKRVGNECGCFMKQILQ